MVAEQSISIHIVQVTLGGVRETPLEGVANLGGVETQQLIKPVL